MQIKLQATRYNMPTNILPLLVDGMWAQLRYGSELSEFSVTFPFLTVPSYRYPPTWVPSQRNFLIVLSRNRQRQGLDVRAIVLSALQSVNVNRFWEECMTPAFFQTFRSIRRVKQRV